MKEIKRVTEKAEVEEPRSAIATESGVARKVVTGLRSSKRRVTVCV